MTAVYQPGSRFWELQGIEFAIVAGIGVLLDPRGGVVDRPPGRLADDVVVDSEVVVDHA